MLRLVRRTGPTVVVMAALVVSAGFTLGWPNATLAFRWIGDGYPTMASGLAFVSLLIWVLLAVAALFTVGWTAKVGLKGQSLHRRRRGMIILALGLLILGMGIARSAGTNYQMCCGSREEAEQLVR